MPTAREAFHPRGLPPARRVRRRLRPGATRHRAQVRSDALYVARARFRGVQVAVSFGGYKQWGEKGVPFSPRAISGQRFPS